MNSRAHWTKQLQEAERELDAAKKLSDVKAAAARLQMQEQLLTLVRRGARIDHQSGDHDDWANACAGVVQEVAKRRSTLVQARVLLCPGG